MIVVRSDLGPYGEAWDRLVATQPKPSPFLRSSWLNAIADTATRIVLIFDRGVLLGGVAFETEWRHGIPMVRFAGSRLSPDHMDLVAAPERLPDVLHGVSEWSTRLGTRLFDLRGVAEGSRIALAIPSPVARTIQSVAPWAPVPPSFEDYWAARPSKLRNTVSRAERRLERLGAVYDVLPPEDAEQGVADFARLHALRWGDASTVLRKIALFSAAVRAGLASGEMVAHRLVVQRRAIAIELWFEFDGIASFYQAGRDLDERWRGAGSVVKARAIAGTFGRGYREIDLLHGDEAYKSDWVDQTRLVYRLQTAHGLIGRLAMKAKGIRDARRLVPRRLSITGTR